jgi:hypothetical protein
MIGSLLYLCASRPDIMLSLCMCARFQANSKECHLIAVHVCKISPMAYRTRKRKAVPKAPLRSRGRRRPNPQGTSAQGARPRIKRASASGSHMADVGESLEYLERIIIWMQPPIR